MDNWKYMFTFATTVPATPLNNAYHGGTSLFYNSMRYTKQPIGIPAQLAIMKQRGLVVNDESLAMKQLASISYFRLASYWKVFNRLLDMFAKYPTISLKQMGFPRDWKSQPLWQ